MNICHCAKCWGYKGDQENTSHPEGDIWCFWAEKESRWEISALNGQTLRLTLTQVCSLSVPFIPSGLSFLLWTVRRWEMISRNFQCWAKKSLLP